MHVAGALCSRLMNGQKDSEALVLLYLGKVVPVPKHCYLYLHAPVHSARNAMTDIIVYLHWLKLSMHFTCI